MVFNLGIFFMTLRLTHLKLNLNIRVTLFDPASILSQLCRALSRVSQQIYLFVTFFYKVYYVFHMNLSACLECKNFKNSSQTMHS